MAKEQPYPEGSALHLISEILDKLIDTQSTSAQATSQMRDALQQSNRLLEDINRHFSNGFKTEIKGHITKEVDTLASDLDKSIAGLNDRVKNTEEEQAAYAIATAKTLDEILKVVKELKDTLERPWFWVKIIAAILGSLAVITAGLLKVMGK